MPGPVIDGNDPVTGHIISTTIGGKNGEPKQVNIHVKSHFAYILFLLCLCYKIWRFELPCCCSAVYMLLHKLIRLLFLDPLDHKLYGRTCCWDWIIWYCFQGILHVIPLAF